LVRHTLTAVRQPYAYYRPSMRWAEPDTAHAGELMRAVRARPEEARARGAAAAKILAQDFSLQAIGRRAHRRLIELLRETNSAKWERLNRTRRETQLRPPVPIPGEWFDADYFEHGLKSNWHGGYTWGSFSGLFRETAEFLTSTFPEAVSFLDVGCAKGFLVRTLRERGKEAWGFDHSACALERAEELVKPFLWQADVVNVDLEQSYDMLLAFSLLESLTEDQIATFLQRTRPFTRQALLAVISTREGDENQPQFPEQDHDLSHITLRSRSWWHDQILQAGWRQDPLHRLVNRVCQAHLLPKRMGWQVYVYAPGH